MITVAIVEDEEQERLKIKSCFNYLEEQNEDIRFQTEEFPSALAFFAKGNQIYDIVLMDIEMPGMNGLDAARKFREYNHTSVLIFVTNMAQYAINGYEVEALDFIIKPIRKYDFALKMKRAALRTQKNGNDSIMINVEGEKIVLEISSIQYVEVIGHSVIYHAGEKSYTEFATLKSVEERLNRASFVKCNRCYLVNLRYVQSVKNDSVTVGGENLILARTQRKAFLNALASYINGEV